MRRIIHLAVTTLTALALLIAPANSFAAPTQDAGDPKGKSSGAPTNGVYIVQLAELPATAYTGGIDGLKPTKPNKGQKIDPTSTDVVRYTDYLKGRHDAVLNGVGGGRKLYSYGYVFNGFAAELTEAQAAALKGTVGVISVSRDEMQTIDTSSTPTFLGL